MKRYFKFLIFIIISILCSIFIAQSIRLKVLGVDRDHHFVYLSNSPYFNAKFHHYVYNAPDSINFIAMGSSMTISNIYSPLIHNFFPKSIYYNYASEATTIPTTAQTIKNFCKEYPIKKVLINCQILDFENATFFDIPSNNKLLLLKHKSIYYFVSKMIPDGFNEINTLNYAFDGSRANDKNNQVTTDQLKNGLKLKDLNHYPYSSTNLLKSYKALDNLCKFLKNNDIDLIISISPISHYYLEDKKDSIYYNKFIDSCTTIVSQNGYILHHIDNKTFTDQDFRDSYHLSYSGAKKFTTMLIEDIKKENISKN